ncbi:MAG: hypothetical protein WAM28_05440 [Chlamydiales bacterium]
MAEDAYSVVHSGWLMMGDKAVSRHHNPCVMDSSPSAADLAPRLEP